MWSAIGKRNEVLTYLLTYRNKVRQYIYLSRHIPRNMTTSTMISQLTKCAAPYNFLS